MSVPKILFVCHGNICRSPMAECVFKKMASEAGLDCFADSAATSTEEIGNGVYPPAYRILKAHGYGEFHHSARQIRQSDYGKFDFIVCMERYNIRNLNGIFKTDPEGKVRLLLDRDVDDPWYTGDFSTALSDIEEGCRALLCSLKG